MECFKLDLTMNDRSNILWLIVLLVISEGCRHLNCYSSESVDAAMTNTAIVTAVSTESYRRGSCYWNNFTKVDQCCHRECLGGCSGGSPADCYACANVFHNGRCLQRCPRGYYQVGSRVFCCSSVNSTDD